MSTRAAAGSMSVGATRGSRGVPPWIKPRVAGLLYLVAVLAAVFAEFIAHGKVGAAVAIVVPIACYAVVTLLLFGILKAVNRGVAAAALLFGLVGLGFEALQLQPHGVNAGMISHGVFCLLTGYLMFRSGLLPRVLGVSMAIAGLVWLIYLSPSIAKVFSPWNSAIGLLAEALPMLWLLVMGVRSEV